MNRPITGATVVAGVVGRPVRHSLSPLIHNAWLAASGVDGVYVAVSPKADRFAALIDGLRGGVLRGVNVTLPFKEEALVVADHASERAQRAGAANLLVFGDDGSVTADNTDGQGLLGALVAGTPGFQAGARPIVMLGAGGAGRGAAAALLDAGAAQVRLINRTRARADDVAQALGPRVQVIEWKDAAAALAGAGALINATSLGLEGRGAVDVPLGALPADAVVMDMVYRPLATDLLVRARTAGYTTVDGLDMLIRQAAPSFKAMFGRLPPADVDVRALAVATLEARS
jgi:shikimate dehydrogenase